MSSTATDTADSVADTASATGTDSIASSLASIASTIASSALSASETLSGSETLSTEATKTSSGRVGITPSQNSAANKDRGIGIVSFLTAVAVAMVVFAVQILLFLLLRNKLARIL